MSASDEQIIMADVSPVEAIGRAFIAAYARGDRSAILALCSSDARTHYVPWGDAGRNPVTAAVDVWTRYPAAFDNFAMPIVGLFQDERRVVVISTLNSGVQRADVDGIPNTGRRMACPHLFVIHVDMQDLITGVEVWCDQLTLYHQLGFPADFAAGGDAR